MSEKPRFKVGDTVYLFYDNKLEKGIISSILEDYFVVHIKKTRYTFCSIKLKNELYATEEEARNANN